MKKKINSILLFHLFIFLWISPLNAQTSVPDTLDARQARVHELETKLTENDGVALKELALIYATIAIKDQKTEEMASVAENYFKKALKVTPDDYELLAAYGSLLTIYARYADNTGKKMLYVKKGTRKMDLAIKREPDNIGARIQRGKNSLSLPVFLRRARYAKEDFQHILDLVGEKKGAEFASMALYNLGRAHHRLKEEAEAKAVLAKVIKMNVAPWSERAQGLMNEI